MGRLELVDMVEDLPHHPDKRYPARPRAAIERVVVHHSATPADTLVSAMARYHVEKRGWPGIGYHFVVKADGLLCQTNRLDARSYHVAGYNRRAVGVCFVGDFGKAPPPPDQVLAGARLIGWLLAQLPQLEPGDVVGHCELVATECPGRQWLQGTQWKQTLLQEIESWLMQSTPTA